MTEPPVAGRSGGSERMRLFVAFDLPEEILHEIEASVAAIRARVPSARWTTRAQQHVTLKFLGTLDPAALEAVEGLCSEAAGRHQRAELRVGGIGGFPRLRRARVLWLGVDDPGSVAADLAAELDSRCASIGVPAEERGYTPHLTLARLRTPQDLSALNEVATPRSTFLLKEIVLYRSRLGRAGARYEALARFPLR